MDLQNPGCLNAASSPNLHIFFKGLASQGSESFFINLKISFFKTKKPPFIHSSLTGFSVNFSTLSLELISKDPNLISI